MSDCVSDCDRTLAWLLAAGPEEFGAPPTALSEHLETCVACLGRARRLEMGVQALSASLGDLDLPFGEERAVELAIAHASPSPGGREPDPRAFGRGWSRWWRWAPLPVAATAALLVLARGPADHDVPGAETIRPESAESFSFAVEAPADRRLVVFQTDNPRIRVVWLY